MYSTGALYESLMLVCALVKGLGDAVLPAASEIQSQGQRGRQNTDACAEGPRNLAQKPWCLWNRVERYHVLS